MKSIVRAISELLDLNIEERKDKILMRSMSGEILELPVTNPEVFSRRLVDLFRTEDIVKYFVYQDYRKEILLLSEVEVSAGGEIRYREPIGTAADLETHDITIFRGKMLVDKLIDLVTRSIPVDEVFGLEDVLSTIPQIISASCNAREMEKGAVNLIKLLKDYEEIKKELGGSSFFSVEEPQVKIREAFVFISSALLPEVESAISEEVWEWAEDEAMPAVFNYEGLNGREARRVSRQEHYDVKSERKENERILEERFIEVKTKMGRSISFKLSDEEFEMAEEKGDSYWLYMVYGVRTDRPVMLCIRNPAKRLQFRRKVALERREEYYFGVQLT